MSVNYIQCTQITSRVELVFCRTSVLGWHFCRTSTIQHPRICAKIEWSLPLTGCRAHAYTTSLFCHHNNVRHQNGKLTATIILLYVAGIVECALNMSLKLSMKLGIVWTVIMYIMTTNDILKPFYNLTLLQMMPQLMPPHHALDLPSVFHVGSVQTCSNLSSLNVYFSE